MPFQTSLLMIWMRIPKSYHGQIAFYKSHQIVSDTLPVALMHIYLQQLILV